MSTRYRDLKRLRRDHPARKMILSSLRAEYRTRNLWNVVGATTGHTLNELQTIAPDWFSMDWRAPVPVKEVK